MAPKRKPSVSEPSSSISRPRSSSGAVKAHSPKRDSPTIHFETPLRPTSRFALAVLIAFLVNGIGNTVLAEYTGHALRAITRDEWDENWRLLTVMAWKTLEIGIGWSCGFDDFDMLSFTILTHVPHAYLLHTLYRVTWSDVYLHFAIACAANTIPFSIFRRRSSSHLTATYDATLLITTSVLASLLYAIPLYLSLTTWLPSNLATPLKPGTLPKTSASLKPGARLTSAQAIDPANLATVLLAVGACAHVFLFTPTLHPSASALYASQEAAEFDAETASLGETLARNVFWWRYLPAREQEIVRRTVALVAWTAANVYFWSWISVQGREGWGAFAWAAVWAVGAALSGTVLGWVASAA